MAKISNKATHTGTCQCCGSRQRLPGGVLAKHGYQVIGRGEGGFFAGTCRGSGFLPLEVSCDQVQLYADLARREEARLTQAAAGALALEGLTSFNHRYVAATWENRRSYHVWDGPVDFASYEFDRHSDGLRARSTGNQEWLLRVAAEGRERYAGHLRHLAQRMIECAVSWEKALAAWAPGTLKEVA